MTSEVAWPYRTPADTPFLRDSSWRVTFSGEEQFGYQVLGRHLEGWDANARITLERQVNIDVATLLAVCGLDESDVSLEAAVIGSTGNGRIREVLWRKVLSHGQVAELDIQLTFGEPVHDGIRGRGALSRNLRLDTVIALQHHHGLPPPFTATRPGSRLWTESHTTNLEGSQPRLTVVAVSFREHFPFFRIGHADYYISLEQISSLESAFLDRAVIYVNTESVEFVQRLSAQDPQVLEALYRALMSKLAAHVFLNDLDRDSDMANSGSGTAGAVLMEILTGAFPEESPETVRSIFHAEPGRFFATIQSYVSSVGIRTL